MRLTKKGDLALSTNAIVVLIIAVIILGLIITFITQGFGAVESKFLGQIESMPDPVTPTATRPITFSETLVGSPGGDFGMKVSVFNPEATAADYRVNISGCTTVLPAITSNSRSIDARSYATFVIVGEIAATAPPGRALCQLNAVNVSTNVIVSSADLIINVRD